MTAPVRADVVVVGAGSGGCVAARGLLDRGLRVVLLEAGGPDTHPLIRAPAAFPNLFRTRLDWNLHTEPQPHLGGRRLAWPRGRVLGGSSAINASIYIRGSRRDFDGWGHGWTWADVLPHFRALETFSGGASATRGGDGPLPVGPRAAAHPLTDAFVESAAAALGVGRAASFNDGTLAGVGVFESNHRRGERYSAYRAFVAPRRADPALTVVTGAHVLRVLWDGARAVGVRMRWQGRTVDVPAGGVVLAGGAVHTPQLLMLSGVGPRAELARHGVDVRVHVPGVGGNLHDHLGVPVIFASRVASLDATPAWRALARWAWDRGGPLASNVAEAGGFVHARADLDPHADPDVQFHFGPAYFRDHGRVRASGHHFTVGPTLVDVHSRGRVTLASGDPLAAPRLDPASLADPRDVASLVAGVRLAREVAAHGPLAAHARAEVLPGPAAATDAALEAHVRREAATLYHPAGTAALGDGDEAVVDRRLAVRGTRGLWVADAAVMPRLIHANTNATCMMIGARVAEFVAQDGAGG